jgi:tetratricopeptide (TPR) repeat protein
MYLNEAEVSCYLGEYTQALALCEQAGVAFRQTGDAVGEAYQRAQSGEIYLALGLAAQAHTALESAARVMRECGNVEESMRALLGLVECRLRENDLEAADAHLRQIAALSQSLLPQWRQAWVFCLEGHLALARRDLGRARALAQEAEQSVDAGSDPGALGPTWMLRAQIALAHGSRDEARACFERAGRAAQAQGSFATKLLVLQEAGAFLAADPGAGRAGQGRRWLEEAAAAQRHLEAERAHLG